LRDLHRAEIERHHQWQQHREFDRRHAALIAAERGETSGQTVED
jgi:hypothetical protein